MEPTTLGGVIGGSVIGLILIVVIVFIARRRYRDMHKHVMISYAHVDREFTYKIRDKLIQDGFRVWIDDKIVPAEDWRNNIARAIEDADAVVFIMSPKSVTSKYCKEEVYYAVNCNVAMFPVVCEDSWNDLAGGMKLILQRLQWIFMNDGKQETIDEKCKSLCENLHHHRNNKDAPHKHKEVHHKRVHYDHPHHDQHAHRLSSDDAEDAKVDRAHPADVYICYDASDPKLAVVHAAFAHMMVLALNDVGCTAAISCRREIRDEEDVNQICHCVDQNMDVETAMKHVAKGQTAVSPKRRASMPQITTGSDHQMQIDALAMRKVTTIKAMEDWQDNRTSNKASASTLDLVAELNATPATHATTRKGFRTPEEAKKLLLIEEEDYIDHHATYDRNVKQIELSGMLLLLNTPGCLHGGEVVDELHYTYEMSKEILLLNCYASDRERRKKADLSGSVGMMLQSAESVDFGHCQKHLKWEEHAPHKRAHPSDRLDFPINIIPVQRAALQAKQQLLEMIHKKQKEKEKVEKKEHTLSHQLSRKFTKRDEAEVEAKVEAKVVKKSPDEKSALLMDEENPSPKQDEKKKSRGKKNKISPMPDLPALPALPPLGAPKGRASSPLGAGKPLPALHNPPSAPPADNDIV